MLVKFPSNFLWGSGISSYQVEGGNDLCDWFFWEREKNLTAAGKACAHYSLFPRDFELARFLSHNSLRLSIEWSRICPSGDKISVEELSHYKEVVSCLKRNSLTPVITLHHFTNPVWFLNKGGWLVNRNIDYFLKYVSRISYSLKDSVNYWIIFNEPLVYVYNGFIRGIWPPGYKSFTQARKVLNNILKAYVLAYQEIKRVCGDDNSKISIAKHLRVFSPCPHYNLGQNSLFAGIRSRLFNYAVLDYLAGKGKLDFIGVNYYCKEYVKGGGSILGDECSLNHHIERKNSLGWNVYPHGLSMLMYSLKKYDRPLLITENGTAEDKENRYEEFLLRHITEVGKAITAGVKVSGYLWWSLLDNFEWDRGYNHRFGLLKVNFNTFEREIRKFAFTYKKICSANSIKI